MHTNTQASWAALRDEQYGETSTPGRQPIFDRLFLNRVDEEPSLKTKDQPTPEARKTRCRQLTLPWARTARIAR